MSADLPQPGGVAHGTGKRLAIMQPYLFPYLGYFQLLHAVDEYVVYDDVNFIKGGWINRNNILMDGTRMLFSISLVHASPNRLINEIEIKDDFSKFLKMIENVYARAPCKKPVMELLQRICSNGDKNLARFSMSSLEEVAGYIGIDTPMILSSQLKKKDDLRGQNKVLHICELQGANCYINSIGGQALYDRSAFELRNISLRFLETREVTYKQFGRPFVSNLSMIDVLMFNEPPAIMKMLGEYELL